MLPAELVLDLFSSSVGRCAERVIHPSITNRTRKSLPLFRFAVAVHLTRAYIDLHTYLQRKNDFLIK